MSSMEQKQLIDLWNLAQGVTAYAGAQRIFNVLGNIRGATEIGTLSYHLNDGPVTPVHFKRPENERGRLERVGDFNIDTINTDQLQSHNRLSLIACNKDGESFTQSTDFQILNSAVKAKDYQVDLTGIEFPEQIGQVVDGHWEVSKDPNGVACLEISEDNAGYDRIILLSDGSLDTGYRIQARLAVTAWTGSPHNVGLVFKWSPHLQGDGTCLPVRWNTGLAYYYSHCRGLRIRNGVDVHLDENGVKVGDYILGEACFSYRRYWLSRLAQMARLVLHPLPQIIPGRHYCFDLLIRSDVHTLTVWQAQHRQPAPQIVVSEPASLLPAGAAGFIAHRCALRVYDFAISAA